MKKNILFLFLMSALLISCANNSPNHSSSITSDVASSSDYSTTTSEINNDLPITNESMRPIVDYVNAYNDKDIYGIADAIFYDEYGKEMFVNANKDTYFDEYKDLKVTSLNNIYDDGVDAGYEISLDLKYAVLDDSGIKYDNYSFSGSLFTYKKFNEWFLVENPVFSLSSQTLSTRENNGSEYYFGDYFYTLIPVFINEENKTIDLIYDDLPNYITFSEIFDNKPNYYLKTGYTSMDTFYEVDTAYESMYTTTSFQLNIYDQNNELIEEYKIRIKEKEYITVLVYDYTRTNLIYEFEIAQYSKIPLLEQYSPTPHFNLEFYGYVNNNGDVFDFSSRIPYGLKLYEAFSNDQLTSFANKVKNCNSYDNFDSDYIEKIYDLYDEYMVLNLNEYLFNKDLLVETYHYVLEKLFTFEYNESAIAYDITSYKYTGYLDTLKIPSDYKGYSIGTLRYGLFFNVENLKTLYILVEPYLHIEKLFNNYMINILIQGIDSDWKDYPSLTERISLDAFDEARNIAFIKNNTDVFNDYLYNFYDDYVEIIGYIGTDVNLNNIPSFINEKPVKKITIIGSTINKIESIVLPNEVIELKLDNLPSLKSIVLDNGKLKQLSLNDLPSLIDLDIPESVEIIDKLTNLSNLDSLKIPSKIDDKNHNYSLKGTTNLTYLEMPSTGERTLEALFAKEKLNSTHLDLNIIDGIYDFIPNNFSSLLVISNNLNYENIINSLTIADSIVKIDAGAFAYLTIPHINLSEDTQLNEISKYAFGDVSLSNVMLRTYVKDNFNNIYRDVYYLKTSISDYHVLFRVYHYNYSSINLSLNSDTRIINSDCFYTSNDDIIYVNNILSSYNPNLKTIGPRAFKGVFFNDDPSSFFEIGYYDSNISYIGEEAFAFSAFASAKYYPFLLNVQKGCVIGNYIFKNCLNEQIYVNQNKEDLNLSPYWNYGEDYSYDEFTYYANQWEYKDGIPTPII